MSTLYANRAHSANPRVARRSQTPTSDKPSQIKPRPITTLGIYESSQTPTKNKASPIRQRPTTSLGLHRTRTDVSNRSTPTTGFELPVPSETTDTRRRSKSTATSSQSPVRQLELDDIGDLLRYLEHEDPFIVKIDSLAYYHKLVQSINLKKTPLNCKLLYELQKLENRIIQHNACRDIRFHSLLDVLSHKYVVGAEQNDLKSSNRKNLTVYQSTDGNIEF